MKLTFATVEVPPNDVNLGATQFFRFAIPFDRKEEFLTDVEKENETLRLAFREHGDEGILKFVQENEKKIKTLRHFRALERINSVIDLVKHEFKSGAYKKLVIFASHRDVITWLQIGLSEFNPVTMYLKSNPHKAEQNLRNFGNPKHKARIFISIIKAARPPIKLSIADHILFAEEEVNPIDNVMAIKTVMGDKKEIFARNFCLNTNLDHRIQELIRIKTKDSFRELKSVSKESEVTL